MISANSNCFDNRNIKFGDRIFVRLTCNWDTIAEFETARVSSYTELLGEVRIRTRAFRGLTRLYVRNVTRGWSKETPLMLYSSAYRPEASAAKPDACVTPKRNIPESIYMRYGYH
ncbi:MAG: hypothetical protein NC204_01345 [Candidatus Amulumruptor caecigallinarius]|nr:hypothetical protein [Candidatus Amulumruptor caecigallinarius]